MEPSVTASEAKQNFGDVLSRCVYGGENVIITKHDKPVAVLVSIEEWNARKASAKASPAAEKSKSKKKKKIMTPIPEEELSPLLREFRKIREKGKAWQKKHGIKDPYTAVEWIRMVRDENS